MNIQESKHRSQHYTIANLPHVQTYPHQLKKERNWYFKSGKKRVSFSRSVVCRALKLPLPVVPGSLDLSEAIPLDLMGQSTWLSSASRLGNRKHCTWLTVLLLGPNKGL